MILYDRLVPSFDVAGYRAYILVVLYLVLVVACSSALRNRYSAPSTNPSIVNRRCPFHHFICGAVQYPVIALLLVLLPLPLVCEWMLNIAAKHKNLNESFLLRFAWPWFSFFLSFFFSLFKYDYTLVRIAMAKPIDILFYNVYWFSVGAKLAISHGHSSIRLKCVHTQIGENSAMDTQTCVCAVSEICIEWRSSEFQIGSNGNARINNYDVWYKILYVEKCL